MLGLLRGGRAGPEVSETLDESEAGDPVLELFNEGGETAAGLRWAMLAADGGLLEHAVGGTSRL